MPIENLAGIEEESLPKEGRERHAVVKTRVNQNFFRTRVLAAYNFTCCITGMKDQTLLIAGHIRPWSVDKKNRLNPRNGLAINALHDKAFENGLITITPEYEIKVSSQLKARCNDSVIEQYFLQYEGKHMIEPKRFLPDPDFLEYHFTERFIY